MADETNNNDDRRPGSSPKPVYTGEGSEEYRLIPVRDLEVHEEHESVIDVIGLLKDLWEQKRTILTVLIVFMVIGAFYYATAERYYYSEASLMPEEQSSRSGLGQLFDQYQNILGVSGRMMQEGQGISIMLYPHIVESLPFQIELMQQEVYFSDIGETVTIFDYFNEYKPETNGEVIHKYSFGLPGTILGWIRGQSEREPVDFEYYSDLETEPRHIDSRILSVSSELERRIQITREPQTDFVLIGASMSTPESSAQVVKIVKEMLQRYVIEYKTEKAMQDLEFVELQYDMARENYRATQDSLASFQDRNVHLTTARSMAMEERLRSDFNVAFDLYNTLARRLEEAKISVQEETPAFRVHEPARIPGRYASPRLTRTVAGSLFLGLFLGVAMVYGIRIVRNLTEEFRRRESKRYFS